MTVCEASGPEMTDHEISGAVSLSLIVTVVAATGSSILDGFEKLISQVD